MTEILVPREMVSRVSVRTLFVIESSSPFPCQSFDINSCQHLNKNFLYQIFHLNSVCLLRLSQRYFCSKCIIVFRNIELYEQFGSAVRFL